MEAKEFAAGYKGRETDPLRYEAVPELAPLIEGPHKWSSFFNEQLLLGLDEENTLTPKEVSEQLQEYDIWCSLNLKRITAEARQLGAESPEAQQFVNELNFHTMSSVMLPLWFQFMARDPRPFTRIDLTNIQTDLAMQSTDIIAARLKSEANDAKNGTRSGMTGVYNGQLTEIDTVIVFLEMMKEDDKEMLTILPAPSQFESGAARKERNADLIFIDREYKEARGIQVKSHFDRRNDETNRNYERRFITIIDGMNDLGNSKLGNYSRPVPNPGLISMDHLQQIPLKQAQKTFMKHNMQSIIRAKSIARELSHNRKSFIPQATHQVAIKALNGIYQGFPGYSAQ